MGFCGPVNPGIAAFEMEYGHWVEEQTRQICEVRSALQAHISDLELHILLEGGSSHYFELCHMKSTATKVNVFYIMSGMWKTAAESFFFWIGGFRPFELLKVLGPHLDTLTESQNMEVNNLRRSCQQAEDADSRHGEIAVNSC